MKLILSPAKRIVLEDETPPPASVPRFLEEACCLWQCLAELTPPERQKLWNCSDAIARLNDERLEREHPSRPVAPALAAFSGLAYHYMAPSVLTDPAAGWVEQHLLILSGLYGVLRPGDGIVPYRLEMGARLQAAGHKNLYEFWGSRVAEAVFESGEPVLDLASEEYSRVVTRHVPAGARLVGTVFGELQGDKVIEKGTLCKMARGEMVRWLAERQAGRVEEAREFDHLNYRFSPEHSSEERYVFLKQETK